MNNSYRALSAFVLAHFALSLSSVDTAHIINSTSAITAFNALAFSLILAARWQWVDRLSGGADKTYLLHRTLGYSALGASLIHWISADDALVGIIPSITHSAGELGEFAVISLLLLGVISALKIIPYHLWKKSHLLMGPLFLLIAWHAFFAASPIPFASLLWWSQLAITILAVIAWGFTLNRSATMDSICIKKIQPLPGAIELHVTKPSYFTYKPGQFANLSASAKGLTEVHPFTIASAPESDTLRFIIKDAGDSTARLKQQLTLEHSMALHGVRGAFTINCADDRPRQIWIAAGVGITPFLAALESLKFQLLNNDPLKDKGEVIDLFYAPSLALGRGILEELKHYQATLAMFNLHLLTAGKYLDLSHFSSLDKGWQDATLYLCGPNSIKTAARLFYRQGGGKAKIYSENFDFRAAITLSDVLANIPTKQNHFYLWIIAAVKSADKNIGLILRLPTLCTAKMALKRHTDSVPLFINAFSKRAPGIIKTCEFYYSKMMRN